MRKKRLALLIVTNDYQNNKLRSLISPETDGKKLADVLEDENIGEYSVELLSNKSHFEVVERVEAFLAGCGRSDSIILYFSGHGIKDQYGQLYFAMTNTDPDRLISSAISAKIINDLMQRCSSKRQVLLLDTCYSGAFSKGMIVRSGEAISVGSFFDQGSGYAIMTASDSMQYAFEGDNISGNSKGSVFTSTLVEGLRTGKADTDLDGVISFDDLFHYVQSRVADKMSEQQPRKWVFNVEGKLIIAKNPNPIAKQLPDEVLSAIRSPLPSVVEGVVSVLKEMLSSNDLGTKLSAKQALEELKKHDSKRVSSMATDALVVIDNIPKKNSNDNSGELTNEPTIDKINTKPVVETNTSVPNEQSSSTKIEQIEHIEKIIIQKQNPKEGDITKTQPSQYKKILNKKEMIQTTPPITKSAANFNFFSLIFIGVICGFLPIYYGNNIYMNFFTLQIIVSLYTGYRFSGKLTIIAGSLIFLPNLIFHLIGSYISSSGFRGDWSAGYLTYFSWHLEHKTLGLGYVVYSLFPFLICTVKKELIKSQKQQTLFTLISSSKVKCDREIIFSFGLIFILQTS
jgi:hypothetical protein